MIALEPVKLGIVLLAGLDMSTGDAIGKPSSS